MARKFFQARPRVIQVVPLGPVASEDLTLIAATIRALYDCHVEVSPETPLPAHAFRPGRGQHDADILLESLFDRLELDTLRIIGVTEQDLFADGRNFVFGYAHMRDRVAIFSTLRLHERYWRREDDDRLYKSRIHKALTHELGHTFHVPHCEMPRCVMHQVEFLWQLDELDPTYCRTCEAKVHNISRRGVDTPDSIFELAGSYMRRRRFPRAAAAYATAAERDPGNAHYHNDHGVALLALGERAAAARAFQRAIQLQPAFPHAYYNLGIVCRERGDARTADYFFDEAVKRDDDARSANRYLGVLHMDYFNDTPRARRYLERFRVLGGDDPDVRRRLGELARDPIAMTSIQVVTESSAPV
jgi:archaemetzincin